MNTRVPPVRLPHYTDQSSDHEGIAYSQLELREETVQ